MTTLHDTSHIPDGPEYWDALADRIAAFAAVDSGVHANDSASVAPANVMVPGLEWLGQRRAPWIVSAAVLAAAVALIMVSGVRTATPASRLSEAWMLALGPRDPVGRLVNDAVAPPELGALLIATGRAGGGARGAQR